METGVCETAADEDTPWVGVGVGEWEEKREGQGARQGGGLLTVAAGVVLQLVCVL